jgi:uncharacterized protein YecT (DUF1311 family)
MKEARMSLAGILLLLSFAFGPQQPVHKPFDEIEEDELRVHLAKQFECETDQIYFASVDQFDFLGKGYNQAAVVASTCMTGTAGPDVHSVFTRNEKGELKELAIQEVKLEHPVLFGNSNSRFRIENGLLVDVYHDTSDRDDPLVIKYKWDAKQEVFAIISVAAAKPYATSYDCAKTEKDGDGTAVAICYVGTLADLDVELAQLYKTYLTGLNAESRQAAVDEQRAWLKKRNKDCIVYKGWVWCLTEAYNTRVAELKKKIDEQKKQASMSSVMPYFDSAGTENIKRSAKRRPFQLLEASGPVITRTPSQKILPADLYTI